MECAENQHVLLQRIHWRNDLIAQDGMMFRNLGELLYFCISLSSKLQKLTKILKNSERRWNVRRSVSRALAPCPGNRRSFAFWGRGAWRKGGFFLEVEKYRTR